MDFHPWWTTFGETAAADGLTSGRAREFSEAIDRGMIPGVRLIEFKQDGSHEAVRPPFTEVAVLTDGGVYDNLGLERVWKRCRSLADDNYNNASTGITVYAPDARARRTFLNATLTFLF
jgi:hypothetical protein